LVTKPGLGRLNNITTLIITTRPSTKRYIVGEMDDREIIGLALKGDEEARENIFFTYYGMVMGIVMKFSSYDRSCADDLAQKTFLKVFSSLDKINEPDNLKSWIGRIAYCSGLDHVRKRKNELKFLEMYGAWSKLDGEYQFSPEEKIIGDQCFKLVLSTMKDIPKRDVRKTVELFFERGLSYPEISDEQNINMEVARKRISRFRVLVKKRLLKTALDEKQ
jgi:RNA polymerase sigma-70 factor, ECF subfamily